MAYTCRDLLHSCPVVNSPDIINGSSFLLKVIGCVKSSCGVFDVRVINNCVLFRKTHSLGDSFGLSFWCLPSRS